MKNNYVYEYGMHRRREIATLVSVTLALSIFEIANFALYCSDLLDYVCFQLLKEAEVTMEELKAGDGFELCSIMVPSLACYQNLTPIYCAAYALPVLAFALTARPHDCFFCLSGDPDIRISNY